jgi:Copper chaperone PCu(A)C
MIRSYASTFAIIVLFLELLIPAVAVTAEYNVGSIAIMNPWSRATPKGSQTAIGYMTITNNGTASDRLIGGSIEIADMFQLHAMTIENDIAKMRDLRDIEIQWRAATLKEAKAVVTQYHKYLKENSLVKSIFEPDILPPEPKNKDA